MAEDHTGSELLHEAEDRARPAAPVTLAVCMTCRMDRDGTPTDPRDGARLFAALSEAGLPEGVTLRPVECHSACERGCTVSLFGGPARHAYVYGDLDPDRDVADILTGAAAYAATHNGLVPWRERPVIFRKQSIARIPPQEAP